MSEGFRDTVIRAITDDGAFRVIAALTTNTVRGAAGAQGAEGAVAQTFGDLLTGAILIREAMAPRLRVQAILKGGAGGGNMVADSQPDGTSRGLVRFGAGKSAPHEPAAALLQVMRTLPSGAIHQGVIEVPPTGGISSALMAYMQDSEQVVSTIAVSTVVGESGVIAAGGYMVQLLPEIERGPLMIMTERLDALPNLGEVLQKSDLTPDELLGELLYGMPFTRLEESRLDFGCGCSQVRLVSSLATLPRSDIEELVRDGEVLEINCDYCGKEYRIAPAQLQTLLTPS
ncbi:Chaperonin (heat shock protein 33) [Minicystis rosea]|nr:Chaperonin (heat shock protein 33) [Minicystis rosea]